MLDKIVKAAIAMAEEYKAQAEAQRARIDRERAGDRARPYAGREFQNPEGVTTPLPTQVQKSQVAFARARKAFEKNGGMKAASLWLAMEIARERLAEAEVALAKHETEEVNRKATGVHRDVAPFFNLMFRDGVEPRHLGKVSEDIRIIISDLIRWDGHDQDRVDPNSPVPAVIALYSRRAKVRQGCAGDKNRSQPCDVSSADPNLYRFGGETACSADQLVDNVQQSDGPQAVEPANAETAVAYPYVLPTDLSAGTIELFTELATAQVAVDPHWDLGIRLASNEYDEQRNVEDTIATLEGMREPAWVTPFVFFIGAARRGGLEAGRAAYREAAVRRTIMQIAREYGVAPVLSFGV